MSVLTPLRLGRRRDEAAEIEDLHRRWSRTPAGEARLDAHVRMMLRRCRVTSGRVLELGDAVHCDAFGPGFTCHHRSRATDLAGLRDATFDVVLAVDVLDRAELPRLIATEINRILAPGGLAYVSARGEPATLEAHFDGLDGLDPVASGVDTTGLPRAFHAAVKSDGAGR